MASAPSQIILLQLFLYAFLSTAAFFLRDPSSSTDDHHLKSSTRLKALTFGQTLQERQTVNQYLEKIKEYEIKQHPEEVEAGKFDTKLSRVLNDFMRRQKDDSTKSINPEENGRHFEGDIVLDAEQAKDIYERTVQQRRRTKRKFVSSELRRWDPHKPIVYSFDGSHTLREQRIIELALQHWHNITCLNFERRNDEPEGNRIIFTDVDGCASNVGRHPLGEPQYVSLSPECIRLGVIAHEVAHALGFWHEQSRPDRDNYVTVRWENIDRDSKGQFLKELPADVDNGSVPYDYGSIMHYRSKAFGRYDDLFTLNTNIADYQKTIGQRDQLSFNDIRLMNVIYCTNVCPKELPCLRGGYTDPRRCDRCRCPDGFTGRLCEEVMPGYGAECGGRLQLGLGWTRITSPGYPTEFREGQECSWLLTALPGQRVQLRFYGEFEMYCKVQHSLCMDYIEIRNSTDFANTGMRYCCYGAPKTTIESATEDMLVLFRSFYRSGKGFQAQVRSIPLNGALLSEPQWSEWSQWSACSASCGACGTRTRQRLCPLGHNDCFGESTQNEVCNDAPCRGYCTKKKFVETKCGGLLDLITGLRCRQEKSVTEPCNEHCCNGFKTSKGRCIRQRANES